MQREQIQMDAIPSNVYGKTAATTSKMHMTIESAIREYFSAIDGTRKDFSSVRHLFDALYHDDFILVLEDGTIRTRDDTRSMHAGYLSRGSEATLIHFRKIALGCIDVKFLIENELEYNIVHVVYSIRNNRAQVGVVNDSLSSIMKARCASDFHMWSVGKYQKHM